MSNPEPSIKVLEGTCNYGKMEGFKYIHDIEY